MIIAVASGKGGTGKTTVAVNLALSMKDDCNVQFLDCDVEEPNAHIFLKPVIKEQNKGYIPVPEIDEAKCNFCGKCSKICVYNAIAVLPPQNFKKGTTLVFNNLCHGCGACSNLCPQNAIKEVHKEIGIIEKGDSDNIDFIHGRLNVGEAMALPLIRKIKKNISLEKIAIIDAPPGTSCPVVASVKDSDYTILVTEPTPFGLNDLILAAGLVKKLKIPFGVVINRSDIGNREVEEYCQKENIPVLMKIPFSKDIAISYSKGIPVIETFPKYIVHFQEIFNKIKDFTSNV
ncbi:MAG: ATP-binding protein [Candidatus Coatesbacteria bacterium]|nr:ATP-binding protein [Candidatus Coatesbacteria bacterium]